MSNIKKIDLSSIKILFLGYGGVAKCVLNYFEYFFNYNINNIYLIDKYDKTFYGSIQDLIPNKNKLIIKIQSENFDDIIINKFNFKQGDLLIDLTFYSNTYFFVKRCSELGINYINTSIEDYNDNLIGESISLQQYNLKKIFNEFGFKNSNKIQSNILIEFRQNPGLIQHYIVYAFNELNKKKNKLNDIWNIRELTNVIDDYKIGTILLSEIDNMVKKNNIIDDSCIYNTWSVSGLLGEGLDYVEMVYGKKNKYIKPIIPNNFVNYERKKLFDVNIKDNPYSVLFLNKIGLNCTLNSICPIIDQNEQISYSYYHGKLIHHGEMFESGCIFGSNAPFITYCYKINKYAEESIKKFFLKNNMKEYMDLKLNINNINDNFVVYDNYNVNDDNKIIGHDSIGCTIFCGDKCIEKIYWCGSILSSSDIEKFSPQLSNIFTPTIVQVAAGVLTGISYIMEEQNKNKGLLFSYDLDTKYVLDKSLWMLGKFFFTEIPTEKFSSTIKFKFDKLI